ncbi:MAG: hypothetical protein ACI9UT_003705 [Flavobacteriales bacterium]|jgi:hypothetical protein
MITNKTVSEVMHKKDVLNLKVDIPRDIPSIEEFKTLIEAFQFLIKGSNVQVVMCRRLHKKRTIHNLRKISHTYRQASESTIIQA